MVWWLQRRENARGEWTVVDLRLGYRVCAYNHRLHGGTHVHSDLSEGEVFPVEIPDRRQAEALMLHYGLVTNRFDRRRFEEVLGTWRFESNRS